MNFKDIKTYPHSDYSVDVSWNYLEEQLEKLKERYVDGEEKMDGLEMQPDFQRGYVWTEEQQIAYCENILKGYKGGKDIYFNNPSWFSGFSKKTVCFDGQQRVGAALAFLRNEIKVFDHYYKDFEGFLDIFNASFKFHIFKIDDEKELIRLYLALNTGGSIHTKKDLQPAYDKLKKLNEKK
jgi:uncharacterized protein with ParB-like and HNH nuclease domain